MEIMSVFPQEARLHNLTYSASLYIKMTKKILVGLPDPYGVPGDVVWEDDGHLRNQPRSGLAR
jgi:DNA-directed RNA polymerase II subunit RPB2